MSENELNKYSPLNENESKENLSRAEKILAIKRAMNRAEVAQENSVPSVPDDEGQAYDEIKAAQTQNDSAPQITEEKSDNSSDALEDWESALAARIALRVQNSGGIQKSYDSEDIFSTVNDRNDSSSVNENITENSYIEEKEEPEIAAEEAEASKGDTKVMETKSVKAAANIEAAEKTEKSEEETDKSEKKDKKKKKKFSIKNALLSLIPNKKDSVPEIIRKIVFLVAIVAIAVCSYLVFDYLIDNAHTQKVYDDLMDDYTTDIVEDSTPQYESEEYWPLLSGAKNLLAINKDVVGTIEIPGADIFYPVLQSDDNEKYLNINIKGEPAKAGAIFMDYRNRFDRVIDGKLSEPNSQNLIIYGHNMANGNMFGNLKQYRNNIHYYGKNPIINLNSNYACYQYKIFAFFIVDAFDKTDTYFDYWNKINFADEGDFYYFVNEAKRRTIRLNDVDVKYGDQLLTLSTCNGIFGEGKGGRFVVLARRVREGEDPYEGTQNSTANPNIKWPSIYYRYNKNSKYDPDAEFVPYG